MDDLVQILKNKPIDEHIKRAILSLYDSAISFWGEDKKDLILSTIDSFEIYSVKNLGEWLTGTQNRKDTINGIDSKTAGLCVLLPISKDGKIVDVRRMIFLEETKTEEEAAFLLSHELFFHAVKSMEQPFLSENIIMTGLEGRKYKFDTKNEIISAIITGGFGLEELSTYYGQYKLMKDTYGIIIDIDPILLSAAISLGPLFERTQFGKVMLNAQDTKDFNKIDQSFLEIKDKDKKVNDNNDAITWNKYNDIMDNFIKLCYEVNGLDEFDPKFDVTFEEYHNAYQKVRNVNSRVFLASSLLDLENKTKKKIYNY